MRCINKGCNAELEAEDGFCAYCGTKQVVLQRQTFQPVPSPSDKTLVLTDIKADEHSEQDSRLLILDEQAVYLAHTDKRLEPEELFERTQKIVEEYQVPVDVQLISARWQFDAQEVRKRIVASLKDHPFKDMKVLMGIDYMGKWAALTLSIAEEQAKSPKIPKKPQKWIGVVAIVATALGVIAGNSFFLVIAALFGVTYFFAYLSYLSEEKEYQQNRVKNLMDKLMRKELRTFKHDDMLLFATAMRVVFKAVSDDIVQQGAKIVRFEGGKGGFFRSQEKVQENSPPVTRQENASNLEI